MCSVCDPYADCLSVSTPAQLDAVAVLVARGTRAGDLEWLDGDAQVQQLDPGAMLQASLRRPQVALSGRWLCSACSRLFLLELNSSAATGDGWRPLYGN